MCVGVLCSERTFVCCVRTHRRTLWKRKHVGLEFGALRLEHVMVCVGCLRPAQKNLFKPLKKRKQKMKMEKNVEHKYQEK